MHSHKSRNDLDEVLREARIEAGRSTYPIDDSRYPGNNLSVRNVTTYIDVQSRLEVAILRLVSLSCVDAK